MTTLVPQLTHLPVKYQPALVDSMQCAKALVRVQTLPLASPVQQEHSPLLLALHSALLALQALILQQTHLHVLLAAPQGSTQSRLHLVFLRAPLDGLSQPTAPTASLYCLLLYLGLVGPVHALQLGAVAWPVLGTMEKVSG